MGPPGGVGVKGFGFVLKGLGFSAWEEERRLSVSLYTPGASRRAPSACPARSGTTRREIGPRPEHI